MRLRVPLPLVAGMLGAASLAAHLRAPIGSSTWQLATSTLVDPGAQAAALSILAVTLLAHFMGLGRRVQWLGWVVAPAVLATPLEDFFFRCPVVLLSIGGGVIIAGHLVARTELVGFMDRRRDGAADSSSDPEAGNDRGTPDRRSSGTAREARARRREGLAIAVLAVLVPTCLLAIGWPPPSGDEPHYLLVAHSLVEDQDLDLGDDYLERAYAGFHPGHLSPHYKLGTPPGSRYSMHGVGFPLFLLPGYAAGLLIAPQSPLLTVALLRLLQIALFGLFGFLLYGLIQDVAGKQTPRAALVGSAAMVASAPLIFAPLSLFPEATAMTVSLAAYMLARSPRPQRLWLAGVLLAILPWLGVKLIPVAGCIALVGLFGVGRRWRSGGALSPLAAAGLTVPLLLSGLLHVWFTLTLYGSPWPAAIYLGSDPSFGRPAAFGGDWSAYFADWRGALRTFVGYFIDQKEGLLGVAPHFLLAAIGLPWLWWHRRRELAELALIFAAYVGPYALSQQLGGQSPPVRPLLAVLWVLAPALAVGLCSSLRPWARATRGGLLALGLATTFFLALDPTRLPHDYAVQASWSLRELSPLGSELWRLFPLWLAVKEPHWWVAGLWLVGVMGLVAALRFAGEPAEVPRIGARAALVTWLLLVALGLTLRATVVVSDRHVGAAIIEDAPRTTAWVLGAIPELAWAEPGGVWVSPGDSREIVLTSDASLDDVTAVVRTLVPSRVRLEAEGQVFVQQLLPESPARFSLALGEGREWRGQRVYRLRLTASAGAAPALQGGADWRQLGAFVRFVPTERRSNGATSAVVR